MTGNNRQEISRREFLSRIGALGVAAAGASFLGFHLHNRQPDEAPKPMRLRDFRVAPSTAHPALIAAKGEKVETMLSSCLDALGGMQRFIQQGDVVVLKPNAGFATPPSFGATTNPELVTAVARACLAAGAVKVIVVDNSINNPERCMRISGIQKATVDAGAEVMLPGPGAFREVETQENIILKRWEFFYKPFEKATKVIGLPAAKHHSLAGATLGMKNWYGLLGGPRNQLHQDINTSIADLATMLRPTLTILDATRVLFRNGPTGGSMSDVREEGIIAAATDPVSLDAYGAAFVGLQPADLPYVMEAEKRGLGTSDIKSAGFELRKAASVGGGA